MVNTIITESERSLLLFLSLLIGRCLQEKVVGDCEAYFPSFYFNSLAGQCEFFAYGGCGGNDNRFVSGTECTEACSPDSE